MRKLCQATGLAAALLTGSAGGVLAAEFQSPAVVVDFESPVASPQPLQGLLRQPNGMVPSPAVILLHGCSGGWRHLDERWARLIASWGYVTLTVDSFGPRGLTNTCSSGAPVALAFDAYRALNFLVQQRFVDPDRVVALGFSQGAWLALTSVERGIIEHTAPNKFRAAIAFYPSCLGFKGNMTVPTLVLSGERDDWTPAVECRNMVEGRDDWGISRMMGLGVPIKLVVYPGAYHDFDISDFATPVQYLGHRLEFDQAARDQSVDAVREFLEMTTGAKEPVR